MARKSLRLPSSWATEINLQSRCRGGILTPKIGAASPSDCPDAGAMEATRPASAIAATSTKAIRLIRCLLQSGFRTGVITCNPESGLPATISGAIETPRGSPQRRAAADKARLVRLVRHDIRAELPVHRCPYAVKM